MWIETLLYAQEAAAPGAASATSPAGQSPTGGLTTMLPFIAIMFAVMYFLMIRPNQKRDRERREMLANVAKGDHVVTSGGICGTVVGVSDKTIVLKVSDEPVTKIEFVRSAIAQVVRDDKSAAPKN